MPIEIESFTTDVALVDRDAAMSGPQLEMLVQEIMRRIERKQKEDQRAKQNASFDR